MEFARETLDQPRDEQQRPHDCGAGATVDDRQQSGTRTQQDDDRPTGGNQAVIGAACNV